ncbi:MAG: TRAP transporter substrate-binding protein [Caryophanon sp.]|nr:TRAP transporter substrate-binding protein [Caryophanon sp.]
MLRKKFMLVFMLAIVSLLAACSDEKEEAASEPYVLKIGHATATDHFGQKSFERFQELVETNSDGQIQVEIYPASELGGEREMLEMLLMGELTMMAPASAILDAATKYMAVWDLPYLFTDFQTAHSVLDGEVGQYVLDSMADKGLVGIAYWENGFRHLTNSVKPVTTVADMAGLNMRTLENPMQIKAWSLTGANAAPLAFNAVYDALKSKQFDAQETPLTLMYSMKFHEAQNHLTLTGHTYSPWPVVVNKSFYDKLSTDLQQVVTNAVLEVRDYNRQLSKEDEQKALQQLKQAGLAVVELSEEEKLKFKQAMSGIYNDVKADVGDEFYNQLMEAAK